MKKIIFQKKEPIYKSLIEDITFQIKNGLLKPHDYLPSEDTLAQQYRISRPSVRSALTELVKENLIQKYPGKGTIIKKSRSLPCSKRKTKIISLIMPNRIEKIFVNPFYGPVVRGIIEEAENRNYRILLHKEGRDFNDKLKFYQRLNIDKVDGFLILGAVNNQLIFLLSEVIPSIPYVVVDYCVKERKLNYIVSDNLNGSYQATKHLISLDHRRISFIGWLPWEGNVLLRLSGYKKALFENGLRFDPSLLEAVRVDERENGYHPMMRVFNSAKRFTAVVFANDYVALAAMRAIKEKGLKIPEDMSIIGYDDIEDSEYVSPPLTTIRVDKEMMGKEGVKRLIKLIENPFLATKIITVITELVIRDSTASKKNVGITYKH